MGCCMASRQSFDMASRQSFDLTRYTDATSLFDALAFTVEGLHPVRLVRMSWLLQQRGTVLKRRQELPEEAFVSAGELRAIWEASGRGGVDKVAPIITISFCWDSREHPDPNGVQLSLVIDTLEQERHKYSRGMDNFEGFSDMGVFWDWPSLLQGDPDKADEAKAAALRQGKTQKDAQKAADEAKRTPAEKAAFKHGLQETMDLWYAHQATTVLLLTQHPRERGSERECGYDQSGWTTYERCSAEQIKKVYRYQAKWDAVADLGGGAGVTKAGRRWPVGPDEFDRLIKDRSFTNGADREAVKALFRRMSRAQLGGVTILDFDGMPPPTPAQVAGLAGCLRLCARLEKLDLNNCNIGPPGAQALAKALPSMPGLQVLRLDRNGIGQRHRRRRRAGPGEGAALHAQPAGPVAGPQRHRRRRRAGPGEGAALHARPAGAAPGQQRHRRRRRAGPGEGAALHARPAGPVAGQQRHRRRRRAGPGEGAALHARPAGAAPGQQRHRRRRRAGPGEGAALHARPADLHLASNGIGDDGAQALAKALPSMPGLQAPAPGQRCPPCPACRCWAWTATASATTARRPWRRRCPPCAACRCCAWTATASATTARRP
ncbi:unnamed protein product [Prorocentrum cordatum]|uniref:Uncharacterized protein n=1 Tax=Prorocentrum cordatum TaxID=2364126 RepID=A0ABN9UDS4_9DINO|nr:unnamed protein product [Polarella glacialis]